MFTSRCLANDWKSRGLQRFFYRVLGTLVVAVSVPAHPPSLREWSLAFPAPYMFTGQRRNSLLPNKSTMAGIPYLGPCHIYLPFLYWFLAGGRKTLILIDPTIMAGDSFPAEATRHLGGVN